jgi:hypothetical protein
MTSGNRWGSGGGMNQGGYYPNQYGSSGYAQPYTYPSQGYPSNSQPSQGYYNNVQRTQPAATNNKPYLAVDGKYYYPDGRPYTPPATAAPRAMAVATTPAAPPPATPAVNMIPDFDGTASVAYNMVRTRLPAATSMVHEDLAQTLARTLEEGMERLEKNLRDALFTEADEASFLAIYKRAFTEDTPQFRLARKNIKYLDAGELRQGLTMDGIVDAGAQIYPAKLEISAVFDTFKRAFVDGRSAIEFDRATKGLLKVYEGVVRSPDFSSMNVPDPEQVRALLTNLKQTFDVRQRLTETNPASAGGMITMDKRFKIIRVPGLPKDAILAIDPQNCVWGTGMGSGQIEIQDGELADLGVPLLHPEATPLADSPKPFARTGVLVQNPKGNNVAVNYVIDGVSYDLKAGESRSHTINDKSQITYNRGGTLGNVSYKLTAGTYRFSIPAQARSWQVTKTSFSVLIDNSANGCEFQCEIDGQPRTIPPQKTLPLTSAYPIAIRFDQGNGRTTSSKILGDTTTVTVGVAPGSSALDLFPGRSQELAVRPIKLESLASQSQPGSPASAKPGRQSILPTLDELQ